MKKILIVNNNLDMGGIQKSLVNLVNEIYEEYDVTLLLFSKSGSLLRGIPEKVKVITPRKVYRILGLEKKDLKKHPLLYMLKAFLLAYTKIFSRRSAMKLLGLFQKEISGYDAVISYSHFLSFTANFPSIDARWNFNLTHPYRRVVTCPHLVWANHAKIGNCGQETSPPKSKRA